MDPITAALVAALAGGVAAGATDVGKELIKDAYQALKAALQEKCGVNSEAARALEAVEQKPGSKGRQSVLQEEIAAAGAGKDAHLLKLAGALQNALQAGGVSAYSAAAGDHSTIVQGSGNVVATGGSVVAGGNIEGGVHLGHPAEDAE